MRVSSNTANSIVFSRSPRQNLLELGASPDVLDNRELTPIYHCCVMDNGLGEECVRILLQHQADLTCEDSQQWNLLHQVSCCCC